MDTPIWKSYGVRLSIPMNDGYPSSPDHSGLSGAAARGAVWVAVDTWTNQTVSLALFVVLGRVLAPREFGLMGAAALLVLLFRTVVDGGITRVLVQRAHVSQSYTSTAFWTSIAAGLISALATFLLAPVIANIFGLSDLTDLVRVLSIVFVLASLSGTQVALAERAMAFRIQAVRRILATAISAAVAVGAALAGAGVWALVAQMLAVEGAMAVLLWSTQPWRPSFAWTREDLRDIVHFGSRYSSIRLLWFLSTNVDNFLIGAVLGPIALGFYVIAYRVFIVLDQLLVSAISHVGLSTFSRLQGDAERQRAFLYRAMRYCATIALPCYVGVALTANRLVPLAFGSQWEPAVDVVRILAVAGAIRAFSTLIHNFVLSTGRVGAELRWFLMVTLADVIGFLVAVKVGGIVAVAVSIAVVAAIALPLRLLLVKTWSDVSIRSYLGSARDPFVATGAMAIVVYGFSRIVEDSATYWVFPCEITIGLSIYVGALVLIAPSLVRETRSVLLTRR
jgi:O-antigen/teichoic acid export membrane protein